METEAQSGQLYSHRERQLSSTWSGTAEMLASDGGALEVVRAGRRCRRGARGDRPLHTRALLSGVLR